MTETTGAATRTDLAWWVDRFGVRRPEAGPPLFRRRSSVYRRKSLLVEEPIPDELAGRLAGADPGRWYALFLAALSAVLFRYRGSPEPQDIVVGGPVAGPVEPEVLPLLLEVGADTPFSRLVEIAGTEVAEAHRHADLSAVELVAALGMAEVTNRHPLFPVVLRVEGQPDPMPDLRNDVTITIRPGRPLVLEYNANVHSEETVARLGRHVLAFLAQGLAQPSRALSAMEYLSPEERRSLLAWSDGGGGPRADGCLHELVERAAQAHPDREAVVFGGETIGYADLNARANRLANYLGTLGAGRGERVGLCLPASADLLVAALAVLKSGAAVVPLVPTFPASRNRMAVEDSGMSLVVTDEALSGRFAGTRPRPVLVDREADEIGQAVPTNPHSGVTADDPVYVLFTSGSTGRPKGAVLEHRTLVSLVRWQRDRGLDPAGQRTLQRTSIGFDVSFQEIFSTLGFGGSLVVAPDEVRDDVSQLPEYIERYGIARLFLPPVALNQLAVAANLEQRSLPTLTEVVVAGEQLQISMPIRRLFHQLQCALDNQYGPTETHVATAFALTGPSTRWPERPPIGRPVRHVRTYILDSRQQLVPAGVPGEIYIGGVGASEGYLDERDTAGRFLADPFAGTGRLYRTGDRARFLPEGDIEFLGRTDDQVKIRGYRIELGDIEAHLVRIPGVQRAVVAVHESEALGPQLAAYVVTDEEPDPARIRRLLLEHLPGHMVPPTSGIVRVDALPLTPTGKVNRRALPPPPQPAAVGPGAALAEGDTEQTVAKVWSRALGLPQVSRDADFIELGGHSLVGIQVVAQLNELYSISLPLRSLLRGTTVAALAAEIDATRRARTGGPGTPAAPVAVPALREVTLPDGRSVSCLQPEETRYLHLDVFGHRTYHRGGIRYPAAGVVFDVGAHIGLFTLYALAQSPGLEVHAFEPCPPLFEALRRNTADLAQVRRYPFGLAAARDAAELTFYPNLTGMSSFHPDDVQERALLSGILRNLGRGPESAASSWLAGSEQYLDERLVASTFTCERRTLSQVLAESGVERISLLKIDVQKAELDVLRGIAPADWSRVDQLAIELHDLDGRLAEITELLEGKGYRLTVEQDSLHEGTVVHFAYAVRP